MIIAVGTKGMLIKTVGILIELDRRKKSYYFINLGQHGRRMTDLAKLFGLKTFDLNLSGENDVDNIRGAIKWFIKSFMHVFPEKNFRKEEVLLIQGDTPATLLGFLVAKLQHLKVAHVEAGLRSGDYLNPFPEEFIRKIVDKRSDILFAPSNEAYFNLKKEGVSGVIYNNEFNTVLDAVRIAIRNSPKNVVPTCDYVLISIHRVENVYSFERMKIVANIVRKIDKKVVWPLHPITRRHLVSYHLMHKLHNVEFIPLQDYFSFIHLIKNASFIITDGGGPQEESYILGTPCLLMRMRTERSEGLKENVLLSQFRKEKVDFFLKNFERFRTRGALYAESPSKIVVDVLENYI